MTPAYGLGNPSEPILINSSFGFLEIAVDGGSAADWFDIDMRQQPTAGIIISFS
ncbi:MAG: SAM hydroxide adenosyltransferase [Pseudomonadota bacterium]|nr:SAM hydroxide adenosyltransferase [Pseudomonadota bacterium]